MFLECCRQEHQSRRGIGNHLEIGKEDAQNKPTIAREKINTKEDDMFM